jgi:hypothetical protein
MYTLTGACLVGELSCVNNNYIYVETLILIKYESTLAVNVLCCSFKI